ncbi:MAG: AbgT family transporter [Proteiniphilum sp.]|nr:AbgT family transporter [Proteiniphilum sp.]
MLKKTPHTLVIIFSLVLFCALLTWIVPSGEFDYHSVEVNGVARNVVVDDSYHSVERSPQTWQIFSAFLDGFERQAAIIAFVLIIGGAFQILNSSRAVDSGIYSFLNFTRKFEKHPLLGRIGVNNIVIILVMLLFSTFGSIFGMSEETLAFVIIIVPLAISMGYDSLTGLMMVYVAAHVGFTGATLNPFTIGIAQGLSGLPLFSGIGYRLFSWFIFTTVIITITLIYAARVKKNPRLSPMYKADSYWRKREAEAEQETLAKHSTGSTWFVFVVVSLLLVVISFLYPLTTYSLGAGSTTLVSIPVITLLFILSSYITIKRSAQLFILNLLIFTILFLVVGVMGHGWYLGEISALFLFMGILAGVMKDAGKVATIGGMYAMQSLINIFIPSGSAKAALTMPILAPFSDVIGLSRQATVMAYQFGDGITNMITPTSPVLIGVLGIAKVPYEVWFKWFWKILLWMFFLGFLLLLPTVFMELDGF